jgi:glycerol-3-phosphate acyltransferase PlsX
MENVTIAIDAMGGDYGLNVTVPASWQILKKHRNVQLILVGDEKQIKAKLGTRKLHNKRLSIKHASQQVEMDELPSKALRNKKDSSMRVAINLVKEGMAQACVSSGNTGALMATARFVLKTLPGVDRPAIIYALPTMTEDKEVRMLDLGANVDSCADHLYQFAIIGSAATTAISGIKMPKVGLLNIGEEEIKGNDLVKHTAQLLSESEHINYMGYVEGDDIFKGEADVVVCDGFVGNVALKTMEGMAKLIGFHTKKEFKKNWYSQLAAIMIIPILRRLKKALDPDSRNGASFIGLQGIVIKSHGGANQKAFISAVQEAIIEVEKNVPQRIGEEVGEMLEEAEFS